LILLLNMNQYKGISKSMRTLSLYSKRKPLANKMPHKRLVASPHVRIDTFTTDASSPAFKTWPAPMIESRGDYREEAHLEDLIGGPLYSYQKTLPRLPIPSIEDTISRFLPTALPLAESAEEANSLKDACKVFPAQAEKLHRRLIHRKEEMDKSSWLQLWWNTAGYLQVRDPVVVNVSYFFHFKDDGTIPFNGDDNDWSLGVKRASSILHSAAEFRKSICTGSYPQVTIGRKEPKTPLCSVAYKYMFNACRIPRRGQDTYRIYDPSQFKHCIVACKGNFFTVDFLDDNGNPLPLHVIEAKLDRCVELTDKHQDHPMIGWFTSCDRDSWADSREELLRVGGDKMEKALGKLESGALMICLDDEEPVSRKQCADIFWTGSLSSGHNRWFDKSIQIMCSRNGKAGLVGEHSMMDGMPMIDFANHVTKNSYSDAAMKSIKKDNDRNSLDDVENIFESCIDNMKYGDSQVGSMVNKAKEDFTALITDHSLDVQSFQGYGSNYIKKVGYSPDAYVQIAMQLAVYRLLQKQVGTYEATQMRPYLHGRTETTRTISPASAAFVKRMGLRPLGDLNDKEARVEKISLLRDAVQSHIQYIGNAGKGKGVDRHFFGMAMLVGDGEETPKLFSHPLYLRAKTWRVSTSHLTHPNFDNWGFGEVVPDGVGIAYGVKSDSCIFNITARREHDWTGRLSHLLEEALLEMKLLNDMETQSPASRL